jgi:FMN phosphatase YigB (HAD superfamily)
LTIEINKARANFQSSIMIDDNLDADIHSSLNAGREAILFNYHEDAVP